MIRICTMCRRPFWNNPVKQADRPYPEHITCSDLCNVFKACHTTKETP